MSNYQDPKYKNGSKWEINGETWYVAGVMSTSDDPAGIRNAKTEFIYIQKLVNGAPKGGQEKLTFSQLEGKRPKFISW